MTSHTQQHERVDNVVQFRRDLRRAPICAQCRISMVIVRGEPWFDRPGAMQVTYRCAECGLRERRDI
jgi:hypothetical protein